MRFLIYHNEDSLVLEGDTIEEIRLKASQEISKRNWKEEDCWSMEVKPKKYER